LGDKIIDQLVDLKIVKTFSDIYRLTPALLEQLPRQGEKSIENLMESIERSKDSTLARLIYAMGIRFVGEQTAKLLARHFKTLEQFLKASSDTLLEVDEVGEKVALSISTQLKNKSFANEMKAIERLGVKLTVEKGKETSSSTHLDGMTFVITGTLEGLSRDEAKDLIENNGGSVTSSVSKKTTYLLCGTEAGSKLQKAEALGVKIIGLEELQKILEK
jgi:DNA ligase (NAD+)